MSIYVNQDDSFEQPEAGSRECPHCGVHAELIPLATPSYGALVSARPRHVGVVFRCAACNEPRFARLAVREYESDRVALSSNIAEIERPKERFQYGYLPKQVEGLFSEALDCYTAGCYNAFASMCRRALHASLAGAETRVHWQELCKDAVRAGEVDDATSRTLEVILFASEAAPPVIGANEAGVLIEVVKDMFYQNYVRVAKLKAAMKMRRYFAGRDTKKVTPIDRHAQRESA